MGVGRSTLSSYTLRYNAQNEKMLKQMALQTLEPPDTRTDISLAICRTQKDIRNLHQSLSRVVTSMNMECVELVHQELNLVQLQPYMPTYAKI